MSPEAGWYADPTDATAVRWWDGSAWSAQTRPAPRELALAGVAVGGSSNASVSSAPVVTVGAAPTPVPPVTPAPAPLPAQPAAPAAAQAVAAAPLEVTEVVDRSRPGARPPAPSAPELVVDHHTPVTPEDERPADRSRPGARRPATPAAPPAQVSTPAQAAAPIRPVATQSAPTAPSAAWIDANFPTAPAGGGSGFGTGAPARFGGAAQVPAQARLPRPPMHWKVPATLGVVAALLLGAVAAVGVPRYLAGKAQAQAALAPDVLTHTAPRTLSGLRKVAVPGMNASAIGTQLTGAGAAWAWAQAYGTRDSFTLYVASDVPVSDRADAVRALTSHDAAATLIAEVSAGLTSGSQGRAVAGTPVDYASPVGGKTWCMPLTVSGVAGGYCLWTSGKEFLQVLTMPGIEQVSAKSTMASLKQMAAAVTKAGPASTLVPKASAK